VAAERTTGNAAEPAGGARGVGGEQRLARADCTELTGCTMMVWRLDDVPPEVLTSCQAARGDEVTEEM